MSATEVESGCHRKQEGNIPEIRARHLIPGAGAIIYIWETKGNSIPTSAAREWKKHERSARSLMVYHILACGFGINTLVYFLH
jgi:hypothetical protein